MKSFVTCEVLGRLGNSLFSAGAALSYAFEHDLQFSMPSTTTNPVWKALYLQHLVHPGFDWSQDVVRIPEHEYRYQPLEFRPEWAEDKIIIIGGYRQSEKYFAAHRERVFEAFGFPWKLRAGTVAVHVRRSDYLIHKNKHPEVTREWYLSQMSKFPDDEFSFFSDDMPWVKEAFGHRKDCCFCSPFDAGEMGLTDPRPEVADLVAGSWCENQIGSASTFAVWQALLNRNPNKRCIFPKQWIMPNWQGTTAADWADVVPTGPGWERA